MKKFICIHGHYYQPPRENPWLEYVESQDSAYPYHDWNSRITAECYGPNAYARIMANNQITDIINNYSYMSFNFGPTLLSWLKEKKPVLYKKIIAADVESQKRFGSHGSALAQAYNHMILPLANSRDKYTQIFWGLKDFEYHFNRYPEGMWLPETAVDLETLEYLAQNQIKFTILAPYQAKRFRKINEEWITVENGNIDTHVPYIQHLPSGKSIIIFFYDGNVSKAVAFEKLLNHGEDFTNRLISALPNDAPYPAALEHIATDGETYGHHHAFGDMGLAYTLTSINNHPEIALTIYGQFLEHEPPLYEVEIHENTAWSCAHGVGRWMQDCGCKAIHFEWNQKWRGPLREALDWLRDTVASIYEEQTKNLLRDPWDARNNYIDIINNREEECLKQFFNTYSQKILNQDELIQAMKWLEAQRHAMLMFTSCGWFFDEVSGIETVQIIQYACRVIQLVKELTNQDLETEFLNRLERVPSNLPELQNGKNIYLKYVKPSQITFDKVAAHYVMYKIFKKNTHTDKVYCYKVLSDEEHHIDSGKTRLGHGRISLKSNITKESHDFFYAVIHYGDQNILCGIMPLPTNKNIDEIIQSITKTFDTGNFIEVVTIIENQFSGHTYTLTDLFKDDKNHLIAKLLKTTVADFDKVFNDFYNDHQPLFDFLKSLPQAMPASLHFLYRSVLDFELIEQVKKHKLNFSKITDLINLARKLNIRVDFSSISGILDKKLFRHILHFKKNPDSIDILEQLVKFTDFINKTKMPISLWQIQNSVFSMRKKLIIQFKDNQQWQDLFRQMNINLKIKVD